MDESGARIKICERNKFNSYVLEIDLGGGDWLCKVVGVALREGSYGVFRRKFRGSNYQLIVQCSKNGAGCFLKAMKIQNGSLRNIIIPAEQEFRGWTNFASCLKSFFKNNHGKGRGIKTRCNEVQRQSSGGQSAKNEREDGCQNSSKQRTMVKMPSLALVILKHKSYFTWELIKEQLQKKLEQKAEVIPIADDRAVSWCVDENELRDVLEKGDLFRGRLFLGRIKKWNMFMHWEYTQIEARYSWIGVEGLPLNFWNSVTFKIIGEACGGLMEIAPETTNQSFLRYAKIKVKGFPSGFLNPIVEIPHDKESFHVGLFCLGLDLENLLTSVATTRGLLARSVGFNIVRAVTGQHEGSWNCKVGQNSGDVMPEGVAKGSNGGKPRPKDEEDRTVRGDQIG